MHGILYQNNIMVSAKCLFKDYVFNQLKYRLNYNITYISFLNRTGLYHNSLQIVIVTFIHINNNLTSLYGLFEHLSDQKKCNNKGHKVARIVQTCLTKLDE